MARDIPRQLLIGPGPPPPGIATGPPQPGVSGSAIAGDALRYIGHQYVYGGHPGPDGSGGWDCSSFVSWVLGHDFGMQLPGSVRQGYDGTSHGPVVVQYASWRGAKTVPSPEAGDLCIWVGVGPNGHIGIAVSPDQMVSALNPGLGTIKGRISGAGPAGAPLIFRQIGASGSGSPFSQGCVASLIPGSAALWRVFIS